MKPLSLDIINASAPYEVYWHEKSRTSRLKSDSESPVNKGGSEGVWKYRWLLK